MKNQSITTRAISLCSLLIALFLSAAGQSPPVKPGQYKVSASLSEVTNLRHFNKIFPVSKEKRAMLAKNLFVVSPGESKQLFQVYEDNDYKDIPSFVTTDAVLQLYHIFFSFTLRTVEEQKMSDLVKKLSQGMLEDSVKTWNEETEPQLKSAALKNVAYFGVAASLIGLNPTLPTDAKAIVDKELALISRHQGFAFGHIFPYQLDYSQFVPRGHYSRTESLQSYFRTMMWFGLAPFALQTNESRADETIRQSLLLTRSLYRSNLLEDWSTIYETSSFYVGTADDITPPEWKSLMDRVFGINAAPRTFLEMPKFEAFVDAAMKMRPARIQSRQAVRARTEVLPDPTVQFRFMGQRYIPDSEILQRLSVPVERVFPTGLDVMAVFGSSRAAAIVDANPEIYNPERWEGYGGERTKLINEFSKLKPEQWNSNLYWGWLNALRALLVPAAKESPAFMKNTAWQDKSLHTALGSWAQLRHDTILYGKQSGAEMGDGSEPAPYRGYVEPNVVFWDRLLQLTRRSKLGLSSRKLITDELESKFEMFEETLDNLKRISEKELRNERLTKAEYDSIRAIGGTLEYLTLSVMTGHPDTWELVNETDKDMATVADVHTGGNEVLEQGVGRANEILVIVPIEGKLYLTKGAVFSYYEFRSPAAERLTDEAWQKMLDDGRGPKPPAWTRSFLLTR